MRVKLAEFVDEVVVPLVVVLSLWAMVTVILLLLSYLIVKLI